MSFLTGTSEAGRAATPKPWRRGPAVWLALTLSVLLALLLTTTVFRTVDRRGAVRVRAAFDVWRTVPARQPFLRANPSLEMAYVGGAVVALAGCFLLVWLAAGTRERDSTRQIRREWFTRSCEWFARSIEGSRARRGVHVACLSAAALIGLIVAWRLGAFSAMRTYGVDDTFASFDHPFHIARAEALLRSLRHGESLRWIANHQGGYPVEFYPLGFAWVEIVLWALAFGQLAIPVIHKLAVIALFLAPAGLFFLMSREDRWPPTVGLAAFALHVCVPGGMWHGGYSELVYVGLVANVSAAVAVMFSFVLSTRALRSGETRWLAGAGVTAAVALWCNPRSGIALVVCVGCAFLLEVLSSRSARLALRALLRLSAISLIAALLAAPELTSLARFGDLYYFVRFTSYSSSLDYLAASIDAVSLPGFALAVLGVAAATLLARQRTVTRAAALALIAYALVTLGFSFGATALVQQLEATRLMPVQRLLTIYLSAVGLHVVASTAVTRLRFRRSMITAIEATAIALVLVVYLGPWPLLSFWSRGLFEVQRSTVPRMALFESVISLADRAAPSGTAILVVGSGVSTHQQLWAPIRADRVFFYDYWMWYWQTRHTGPYDPLHATRYDPDRLAEIFERTYLDAHAIGAVVVTPEAQAWADSSRDLQRQFGGDYGLYTVRQPTPVVTFGTSSPTSLSITNHRIDASGTSGGTDAVIRRNWFPRWRAEVNGQEAEVLHTGDGYMRIRVPAGPARISLRYALDGYDVAARAAAACGLFLSAMLLWRRRSSPPHAARASVPASMDA